MMIRSGLATRALLLALMPSALWARSEFHLGSGENTWETFITPDQRFVILENGSLDIQSTGPDEATGWYLIVDEDGTELDRREVSGLLEVGGGTYLPEYNYRGPDGPSIEGDVLQAVLVDPMENLALLDNLYPRGGGIFHGHNTGARAGPEFRSHIDGDPTTTRPVLFTVNPLEEEPLIAGGVFRGAQATATIINLGLQMPINRVRIYPRLGRVDDAAAIAAMAEPKPDPESFGETSFAGNYLEWYEIAVTDNDAPIRELPGSDGQRRPGHGQWRRYSENTGYADSLYTDPNLEALIQTRDNIDPVIDFRFPTRDDVRMVSFRPYIPTRTWEVAEIEIYGEGYVRRSVYRSRILDFGRPVTWSKIRWSGEHPPGTRISIRTRTGETSETDLWQLRTVAGGFQETDFDTWNREFPSEEAQRTLDRDNWSFWSATYSFAAGLRDERAPAAAWTDGTQLLSPGPSRYLQLEIVLEATADQTPRLEDLSLLFSEALAAEEVVGEIWPIEVDSFEPQPFTYVVKPVLSRDSAGFDRLEIFTYGPAEEVSLVVVGADTLVYPDRVIDESVRPQILSDRIILSFDRLDDPEQDSEKRIEVQFSARVLRFGAEFSGWVYDSREPELKQTIRPGNATIRFVGDVLSVRTPAGGDLVQRLEILPRTFTPNNDGVNDSASIAFNLRDLTDQRPVDVRIWTLNGHSVRHLIAGAPSTSGHFTHSWDGRDEAGQLAPPGIYIVQVVLHSDEGRKTATGTLSLVY